MRSVVVALGLVAIAAPAYAAARDDGAAVLSAVDDAFAHLVDDDASAHAFARKRLARAAASFDDLDRGGDGLQRALVGDATKPWRGRAFERVLSLATLAALEIERGRCDLALPTLQNAALHDARVAVDDLHGQSDAVVVAVLSLRCLADGDGSAGPASAADVERARDALRATLRAAGDATVDVDAAARDLERRVRDPHARLVLTGWAPLFARAGAHGEQLVLTPRNEDEGIAGVVRLGPSAPRGDEGLDGHWSARRGAVSVWSSTTQATAVRGRPFDAVRAVRARDKDAAATAGRAALTQATTGTIGPSTTTAALFGRSLQAAAGAGLWAVSAAIDARADDRFVPSLPGRVWLVVPDDG